MGSDEQQAAQPGLRPLVGAAVVLVLVALALGIGFVLRQAGGRPSGLRIATPIPGAVRATGEPVSVLRATPTPALGVAVPAGTGGPPAQPTMPTPTAVAEHVQSTRAPEQRQIPLAIGTLQAPPQPTHAGAVTRTKSSAPEALDATSTVTADTGEQSALSDETYTGLPVALPVTAVLGGVELPVGPAGVRTDGARAFAQTLLGRAQAHSAGVFEDPALRQVAEQALVDELTVSTPTGRVVPTRRRQGSVTVQIDVVATLPDTAGATLRLFSSASVPAMGVAVGVAGRVEPDYLPDLVAVAAVAYR